MHEELRILSERLNLIQPEIKAYSKTENRLKRIDFLVSTRQDIQKVKEAILNEKVDLSLVKSIVKKDLKKKKQELKLSLPKSFQTINPVLQREHEADVAKVKKLSKEFSIIDKLTYLLYIITYTK